MTCDAARKQFSLHLYGELSFDDEETFEQHLDECAPCRTELERERHLHRLLDAEEMEPPAYMLSACRRRLRAEVAEEKQSRAERGGWFARLAGLFTFQLPAAGAWKPVGALALIAMGFFAARISSVMPGGGVLTMAGLGEPTMMRVRELTPDPSGNVQIVLEETRQRTLSGRLGDENIQRLLLAAAREGSDPGLRVESMEMLKSQADQAEVRQALLQVLRHDPNAGVRLKALEALKQFAREPETRQVLAQVLLADDNPGVRTQTIDLLIQDNRAEMVGVLQQLLQKEDNNYIRMRTQKALREMKASVGTF